MKFAIVMLALVSATAAHADGFLCRAKNGDGLTIQVYNHTHAASGTRNVGAMVISDDTREDGDHTIARFSGEDTLNSSGATYTVDVAKADDKNDEAQLEGITLGGISKIRVAIDYNFSVPVDAGDQMPGQLSVKLADDSVQSLDLTCSRYLKNSN